MGYELEPRSGSLPVATEIARLLEAEFRYVRVDPDAGSVRQSRLLLGLKVGQRASFSGATKNG